jgi:hypothetical protein
MPCREHVPPDVTACVFGRSSSASASLARQLMGRGHGRHPGRHAVLGHHDRGSGLRSGDANISTVSPYAQFNVGIAREFLLPDDSKPMTLRFDIINLFETVYQIRSGSGIGVFAAMRTAPRLPRHIEKDLKAQTVGHFRLMDRRSASAFLLTPMSHRLTCHWLQRHPSWR